MGLWDNIKNIMTIPADDELEDEELETKEEQQVAEEPAERKEPRIIRSRSSAKITPVQQKSGMQVILVKPDRYEGINTAADHLNEGKTLVVNLEDCDEANSRRIVDFLSGVAYANHGNMNKVAKNTFIFVCQGVDIFGEQSFDDFDENNLFF